MIQLLRRSAARIVIGAILLAMALETLTLSGTRVTDAGLKYLKNLSQLNHLELDETQVPNAGMTHVASLPPWQLTCEHDRTQQVLELELAPVTWIPDI